MYNVQIGHQNTMLTTVSHRRTPEHGADNTPMECHIDVQITTL